MRTCIYCDSSELDYFYSDEIGTYSCDVCHQSWEDNDMYRALFPESLANSLGASVTSDRTNHLNTVQKSLPTPSFEEIIANEKL